MEFNGSVSPFTFTCTSTGSPPTTVIWTKDNEEIVIDGTVFRLSRTVVNRTTATFKNVLTVDDEFADMIGNYSCSVVNVFGWSESKSVHLKGSTVESQVSVHLCVSACPPPILMFECLSMHYTYNFIKWVSALTQRNHLNSFSTCGHLHEEAI